MSNLYNVYIYINRLTYGPIIYTYQYMFEPMRQDLNKTIKKISIILYESTENIVLISKIYCINADFDMLW